MDKKVENALIRTFKKVRERADIKNSEIVGLFVNFYYTENNIHGGLDTRGFTAHRDGGILQIRMGGKSNYYPAANLLYDQLQDITAEQFYVLWLRSSFEDPNNGDNSEVLRQIISVEPFIKAFQKNNQ